MDIDLLSDYSDNNGPDNDPDNGPSTPLPPLGLVNGEISNVVIGLERMVRVPRRRIQSHPGTSRQYHVGII